MILEKLTIIDTFKQWRDKINAIVDEYEGVPSTDKTTGIMTIDTDRTQAESLVVDIPSTFNDNVLFTKNVTIEGELDAIAKSAKKLNTPVQFNGTLFDGSKDIVTNLWGATRDIKIADYNGSNFGKLNQVNGSENYIFRMPETFKGYLDGKAASAITLEKTNSIDGIDFNGLKDVLHFAVCSTAAGVKQKAVTIENFKLREGAVVHVKFMNDNTAEKPTLKVGSTTAKEIYLRNKNIEISAIKAGGVYTFVYDGTYYNLITGIDNAVEQKVTSLNAEYPILASSITDSTNATTTTLFSPDIVINPSTNSIRIHGNYYTTSKFIANVTNDSSQSFFTVRNSSDSYSTVPNVSTYVRYLSYDDNSNHMLGAFEFQKNADNSKYSNIVVPKFNSSGTEISHSVLQVGWDKSGVETLNFNGNSNLEGNVHVKGNLTVQYDSSTSVSNEGTNFLHISPYGWLKSYNRDSGNGMVRELTITADKYTNSWDTIGAGIALYSKDSGINAGQLVLKGGNSTGAWAAFVIQPTGDARFYKRSSTGTATNLVTIDNAGNTTFAGQISATKVYGAVFNDYAEFFEKGEETEVGDVVALDFSSDEERYVKASKDNPTVVGVHSDTYGHILGGSESIEESSKTHIPVGLVGRVKTKIVGKIRKGEYVVLSDIPGVGCAYDSKKNNYLDIFGVAVEGSEDENIKMVKIKLK